jgi:hypothetical protein
MDKETTEVFKKQRKKEREETNKNRVVDSHSATNKTT